MVQKSCPHCAAEISVASEKITGAWAFLQCHECTGISTVTGDLAKTLPPMPRFVASRRKKPFSKSEKVEATPPPSARTPAAPKAITPPAFTTATPLGHEPSHPLTTLAISIDEPNPPEPEKFLRRSPRFDRKQAVATILRVGTVAGIIAVSGLIFKLSISTLKNTVTGEMASYRQAYDARQPVVPVPAPAVKLGSSLPPPPAPAPEAVKAEAPAPKIAAAAPSVRHFVRVTARTAILRAGPGQSFGKVGLAKAALEYEIKGSMLNWFEVEVAPRSTAWIRGDLVQTIAANDEGKSP